MPSYKVLCTKKIAPSLVSQAAAKGIEIIEKEFISITPVMSSEKYDAMIAAVESGIRHIVFTSANAAAIVCSYLEKQGETLAVKIFALAGKTRDSLGVCFSEKDIAGTANHAEELAAEIIKQRIERVVFCCGNKRRNELPDALRAKGIEVIEVIVYETKEVHLPAMQETLWDAVLFFSPSAVSSFFTSNTLPPQTLCFAIGQTTAAAIERHTINRIITSVLPDEKKMMDNVYHHFSI